MWAEIATRLSLSDCMVSELVCSSWRQNSSVTALGNTITFQHSTSYFAVSKSLRDEQPHIYLDFRCKNKSLVDWTLKRAQGVSSLGFRESSYPADKPWPLRCFLHYLFSRLCNISIPTLDIWLQNYLSLLYRQYKHKVSSVALLRQADQRAGPSAKCSRTAVWTSFSRTYV